MDAFDGLVAEFLNSLGGKSPRTFTTYQTSLHRYRAYLESNGQLASWTPAVLGPTALEDFYGWLVRQHGRERRATVATHSAGLRAFVRFLARRGLLASGVTYDWDTDTLFIVGDGGTSVVQVSKSGAFIDSMTLAQGNSPQGTEFYDTEGIAYVGSGTFVLIEERYRQVNQLTYTPGGTLHRSDVKTVKLGTTVGNVGLEGISSDPLTGGFILVKEKDPQSIFKTNINFNLGTATNGSLTIILAAVQASTAPPT